MPRSVVAYVVTHCAGNRKDYMGAVMATDEKGLPLEFSYTSPPIAPTRLQRILFGSSLDPYVRRDVIGGQLVKSLKNKPDVIVTSDELLLALESDAGCPIIRLQDSSSRQLEDVGDTESLSPTLRLIQLREHGNPYRATSAGEDPAQWDSTRSTLIHLAESMDILEPLERVASAIELIWQTEHGEGENAEA
jgi:hypothetical protein